MPELSPLPPRPATPSFIPRSGDLYVALGQATVRRRRDATVSALVAVTSALLAVALTGHSPDRLHVDQVRPGPEPERTTTARTPEAGVPAYTLARPGTPPSQLSPSAVPAVPGPPAGSGSPSPVRSSVPPLPAAKRDFVPLPGQSCGADAHVDASSGWCYYFGGHKIYRRPGEVAQYTVLMCRDLGRGSAVVTFAGDLEVDLYTFRSGTSAVEVWRHSEGREYASRPHQVEVAEMTCLRWRLVWDTSDNARVPLPVGDSYHVRAEVHGDVGTSVEKATDPIVYSPLECQLTVYE